MTPTSLAPEQAAHVGMSFEDLCAWLVEDASCDR
jgi:D-alanine-D-alanine ligase